MGAAYAQDLRDRVLAAYDRGMATKQIASLFQVSSSWARRVKQRRRDFGETRPRRMGGATIFKIDLIRLADLVRQQPDATGPELRARLGIQCTDAAIYLALRRLGLTFKKSHCGPPSKRARRWPSNARAGAWSRPRLKPGD
jgi:transposase